MALVQGDTTTVLAAALGCFYRRIPIGHVEAGLRTGNIWSPFPEEANRKLATPLVTLHFAPTDSARAALLAAGIPDDTIEVTGNTGIDALLMEVCHQKTDGHVGREVETELTALLGADWETHPFVLITGHRRENFGKGFDEICRAIAALAERFPDHRFVYPVHLNPNVKDHVHRLLDGWPNVRLVTPQGYRMFVALMARCQLVLTDSGGVQEEAPALGKPVLVMRDTTERPEGVAAGTARLTGPNADAIVSATTELITRLQRHGDGPKPVRRRSRHATNPGSDSPVLSRLTDRGAIDFALISRDFRTGSALIFERARVHTYGMTA